MTNKDMISDLQLKHYFNHANIVYLSTVIACIFITPIFIIFIGNIWLTLLCFTTLFASIIALKLNKLKRFGLASLIFIGFITLQTFVETMLFGMSAGFVYYYFNMAGLIIYTNWKSHQKVMGVTVEISLFIIVTIYAFFYEPAVMLSDSLRLFFLILNLLFNIVGVSNSALYYVRIANEAQLKLSKLALADHLTGLPNRTAIAQYFDQLDIDLDWHKRSIAVLMIDIDHFKDMNDTYGHLAGDSILQQLGSLLNGNKRDIDFLARYGGEEFIILIPIDEMYKLKEIAEGYRFKVASMPFDVAGQHVKLTVSIGAYFKPYDHIMSQQEAIENADKLLYLAKQNGRNQVCFNDKG